jgi:SAM-dependent methyltransferase
MRTMPELSAQREYYDDRWRRTSRANLPQLGRAIAILEGLRAMEQKDPRILDLGCGTGWLSGILGRFGPTTGLDLSSAAIERARQLYPDVGFVAGDLFSAPLPHRAFDAVVSLQVIEHVEDQGRFVDRVADVLRPGGHLLLITDNPWNIAHWRPGEFERFAGPPQPIQKRLTRRELRRLLSPRFRLRRLGTILPGYGDRGILRAAHSVKLGRLLGAVRLRGAFHRLLLGAGFGLLLFAHAQRRD